MPDSESNRNKPAAYSREVDAETAGQRLDNFLLACLKGVPRSHVYRLIRSGQVRVNSGRSAPSYKLRAGDHVRVPPVTQAAKIRPAPAAGASLDWLERRIVFEDARLLVLDKPAGLAVHGGSGLQLGCIEALRSLRPQAKSLELVHRLDRATSGCLLVAKRRSALRMLHAVLREGGMEKRYLALVKGLWEHGAIEVEAPLSARRREGEVRVRVDETGKLARSRFRRVDAFGRTASLVEVVLLTGRTHQIRVHAAHVNHPLAGDDRYGDKAFNKAMRAFGLERMFLHAHSVAFTWPDTGQEFAISVPLPEELAAVLDALAAASSSSTSSSSSSSV
jgi:23S rRNA pseudouridine955/2504/2580 synthase